MDTDTDDPVDIDPTAEATNQTTTPPLTQAQLQQQMWASQIRNDYMNVPPTMGLDRKGPKIHDEHFRDENNNIINSGRLFIFAHPRYRWFLTGNPPFTISWCPEFPRIDRADLTHLRMTQIGVAVDPTEDPDVANKTMVIAYLRVNEADGIYTGWSIVDRQGNPVPGRVMHFQGCTEADYNRIARKSYWSHVRARVRASRKHGHILKAWGRQRRHWEWELFKLGREHYHQVPWPRGLKDGVVSKPTPNELRDLKYHDVISKKPIHCELGMPNPYSEFEIAWLEDSESSDGDESSDGGRSPDEDLDSLVSDEGE